MIPIDPFTYAVTSVMWSLAGLALAQHPVLAELVVPTSRRPHLVMVPFAGEVAAMPDKATPPRKRRPWRPSRGDLGLVLMLVVALAVGVQAYRSSRSDRELVECLRTYANASADALVARTDAAAKQAEVLDEVMSTVSEAFATGAPSGREEVRGAIDKFLSKRAETIAAQKKNPYPDPPREVCKSK